MPTAPRSFVPQHRRNQPSAAPVRRFDNRESSWERGYDGDWRRLRKAYVDEHPLCEKCVKHGRIVPVHEVDHIVPFAGKDDPLRLDPENLQSLCRSCHATKTAADNRRMSNG